MNGKDSEEAISRSKIVGGSGRVCINCGIGIESENRKDNPDYTSEAGRVQLLKLMKKGDFVGFIEKIGMIHYPPYSQSRGRETIYYIEDKYMTDDNGAFAIAARDFLKAMEGK